MYLSTVFISDHITCTLNLIALRAELTLPQFLTVIRTMKTQVEQRFCDFFEQWMTELEELHHQLMEASKGSSTTTSSPLYQADLQALVSKLTTHYKKYYTVKWAAAHEDVVAFYCPVWLTPLENAHSWVTGFKPSAVFKLIETLRRTKEYPPGESMVELSEEQEMKLKELRIRTKLEEEKIEREMERQQVGLADRKMVELARLKNRVRNAQAVDGLVDVAMKGMLAGLQKVMKGADCVRLKTLKGVLDMMNPLQCVEFLAAMSMVQIRIRQWGMKNRDQI